MNAYIKYIYNDSKNNPTLTPLDFPSKMMSTKQWNTEMILNSFQGNTQVQNSYCSQTNDGINRFYIKCVKDSKQFLEWLPGQFRKIVSNIKL